jgi:hypothetical protein
MKKISYTKYAAHGMAEIFQSVAIKFSLLNKNNEEITNPAICRDFLGDTIWSRKTGKSVSIYGFHYDYKKNPYDDLRLVLQFPNEKSKTNFMNNLDKLHEKEKQAKVKESVLFMTENPLIFVIKGDNRWMADTWKFSLWSFYLKLISYENEKVLAAPEVNYYKYLTKEVEDVMLSKIADGKEIEVLAESLNNQHNYAGFVSLIQARKEKHSYGTANDNAKAVFGE